MNLYPLKFSAIYKDKVWGGNRLENLFGKQYAPLENCGESWEISAVDENVSVVRNGFLEGNDLGEVAEIYMGDLLGDKIFDRFGKNFPLLVKLLDTSQYLSVQVHPDDAVAMRRHQSKGKSEMWYILDAQPGSEIIVGFKKQVTSDTFQIHLQNGTLSEILNVEKVSKGDVFYIPAGRVHAIGAGITLCEIQQSSDVTYRIFDWDRPGMDGKPRELHIAQALEVMDFSALPQYKTPYEVRENGQVALVKSEFFTTNLITFNRNLELDYIFLDSFVIYVCIEGKCTINHPGGGESLVKGETILIPAELKNIILETDEYCKLLETYIH